MKNVDKLLERAEYVDDGHPGVWPGGENPRARAAYDQRLAEQGNSCSYPVERTR